MPDHPLTTLAPSNRILARAQTEPLSFALFETDVIVRNEGYPDPENHEYRVTVRDGLPVACTCPAAAHYDEPCKHQVAVAIRRPILDAVAQVRI